MLILLSSLVALFFNEEVAVRAMPASSLSSGEGGGRGLSDAKSRFGADVV